MNWETCSHRDECINGCRYGKGCYEDDLNNAMGGKPWGECMCGIDENGNVPNSLIKDLKKQATIKEYSHGAFGESEIFYRLDAEKFAELIIKECIISATTEMVSSGFDSYDELTEYERGCDDTAALIASRIKDKFKNYI